MNPKVDAMIAKATQWQQEFTELRAIVLDCGLAEDFKWGQPCYTLGGKNIVLIHGFKEYCALLFFKGALLSNADHLLIQQTENVQAARQARFTTVEQIKAQRNSIKVCVFEAIEIEKAGLKVALKKTEDFVIPEELKVKLDALPALKTAFEALTPGRQRAYLFHFSQPKQAKTREARIDKYIPHILSGKGIND